MLILKNIGKIYNEQSIFKNANLTASPNECIALVGNNGAGKTTLMKIIAGFVPEFSGTISREACRISGIIENPAFFQNLTVKQNLNMLNIAHKGTTIPNDLLDKTLQKLSLTKYVNVKFKKLSLGTKQKVNIANSLLSDSNFILLDEPFNGLDVHTKEEVKKIIADLITSDICVVISSHLLEELNALANKVWYIHDETIQELQKDTNHYNYQIDFTNTPDTTKLQKQLAGISNTWILNDTQLRIRLKKSTDIPTIIDRISRFHILQAQSITDNNLDKIERELANG